LVQSVTEFDGKKLQSLAKPGLQFGDEDNFKEEEEKATTEFKDLIEWMQKALSSFVDKVSSQSPLCFVINI
jgi:molecular chaperone HtpG